MHGVWPHTDDWGSHCACHSPVVRRVADPSASAEGWNSIRPLFPVNHIKQMAVGDRNELNAIKAGERQHFSHLHSFHLSIYHPSIHLFIYLSIYVSVYPFVYLPVCLSVCPFSFIRLYFIMFYVSTVCKWLCWQ